MCTLTWTALPGGYFVAFNRDERRSRAPGLPPRVVERGGVRAVAPIDGEAGGTWIAVNEQGCTLALLNGYRFQGSAPAVERAWTSRGKLVLELCDAATPAEVAERVAALDLELYRPFELAVFDAQGTAGLATWNGHELSLRALAPTDRPLISSSFDDTGARRERRALFDAEFGRAPAQSGRARGESADPERELERFHASHAPSRGAYSPCMHRDDAQTVSFTRVRVTPDEASLVYSPSSPCAAAPAERLALARRVTLRSS
jgi:hypothetical protein